MVDFIGWEINALHPLDLAIIRKEILIASANIVVPQGGFIEPPLFEIPHNIFKLLLLQVGPVDKILSIGYLGLIPVLPTLILQVLERLRRDS